MALSWEDCLGCVDLVFRKTLFSGTHWFVDGLGFVGGLGKPVARYDGGISGWRRMRRRLYWALARLLMGLGQVLPLCVGRGLGVFLASLGLLLRSRERNLALANLSLAFPDWSIGARRRLLWQAGAALGRNFWDFLAAPRLLNQPGLVRCQAEDPAGEESLVEVLRRLRGAGRGVLVLAGHLGCWELCGAWLSREIGGLAVVTGTIHNPPVDRMVQNRRQEWGMTVLARDRGPAPLLRTLRAGGVVAVLLDQNVRAGSERVPFFGHPAPTATAFAKVALKYDIPILPVAISRQGQGHVITHLPPLDPANWSGGDGETRPAAVWRLLEACNNCLEDLIRRNPAEWVWFHDRWDLLDSGKSVGPGGPGSVQMESNGKIHEIRS